MHGMKRLVLEMIRCVQKFVLLQGSDITAYSLCSLGWSWSWWLEWYERKILLTGWWLETGAGAV